MKPMHVSSSTHSISNKRYVEEMPSCATLVAWVAAFFFLLSASTTALLYVRDCSRYMFMPMTTGAISLVVWIIAGCWQGPSQMQSNPEKKVTEKVKQETPTVLETQGEELLDPNAAAGISGIET